MSEQGGAPGAKDDDVPDFRHIFNRRLESPGDLLMETLEHDGMLIAPGCFSAMDAKLARLVSERNGGAGKINAVYGSGWSASVMLRALPDMGFHDRTEIVEVAERLVFGAHPLPLIMDILASSTVACLPG